MKKIMFVCHGNICRSPMAEFIFKDLVKKRGLEENFLVVSSATSTEEIGNPIYPPAREELRKNGISLESRKAVRLQKDDYEKYDLFVCMDSNNMRNIKRIFLVEDMCKVKKLMDFTARGGDVADPWYSDRFDIAFNDIKYGCEELLKALLNEGN
ncbi:MAG: low molecular weight phosphotyrosine protein phosphatase [Clostridia bacterium]|nr:low molecular weight phosphotyrosine protein phosphatase [Clostridia bacterium]